jgi:hypothetical protein
MSTVHHVNSKHHMLSNHDIMLVAAHDHPDVAEEYYKKAGSPKQATPIMLLCAIFTEVFGAKHVVRMREGNTLFAIEAHEEGAMFLMFDADTPNNTIKNIVTATEAARKMGFTKLISHTNKDIIKKMSKRAFDKHHKKGDSITVKGDTITVELAHV